MVDTLKEMETLYGYVKDAIESLRDADGKVPSDSQREYINTALALLVKIEAKKGGIPESADEKTAKIFNNWTKKENHDNKAATR